MMRVALQLDLLLGGESPAEPGAMTRAAAMASLAGADGIAANVPVVEPDESIGTLRDAAAAFDGPFMLLCPLRDETLRVALEVRPDLTILTARTGGLAPLEEADLNGSMGRESVQTLRASRLDASVLVAPRVSRIKAARHVGVDTAILDAGELVDARDSDAMLHGMEALEAASLAADKLGMRTLAAGNLSRHDVDALAGRLTLDGVLLGGAVIQRALFLGLGAALAEIKA